jgi:hypothetical protein
MKHKRSPVACLAAKFLDEATPINGQVFTFTSIPDFSNCVAAFAITTAEESVDPASSMTTSSGLYV